MPTRRKILACALLFLVLTGLGFHVWLNTGPLRRSVLQEIAQYYDGKIELDLVSCRFGRGLALRGLRFHASPHKQSPIICEIPQLDLEGSTWDLLRGRFKPTAVNTRNAKIRALPAADGKWIFDPPLKTSKDSASHWSIPIEISDASIELVTATPGVSKIIRHVDLTVHPPDAESLTIVGKVDDVLFGNWTVEGSIDLQAGQFHAQAACPRLPMHRDLAVWGVSPTSLWKNWEISGDVAVEANFHGNISALATAEYQIVLDASKARVKFPASHGTVRDLAGRVEITREQVRVHQLSGELANGQIFAAGILSRSDAGPNDLCLEVRRLDVRQFVPAGLGSDELRSILAPAGSLSGKFQAQGLGGPDSWTGSFDGSLEMYDSHTIQSIPLQINLAKGYLEVHEFEWHRGGGRVQFNVRVPIHEDQDIHGNVRLSHIALESLCRLASSAVYDLSGIVDGELNFRVPAKSYRDGQAWIWSGPVHVRRLLVGDLVFDSIEGSLTGQNGSVKLTDASAIANRCRLTGDVAIALFRPYDISGNFRMQPMALAEFATDQAEGDRAGLLRGELALKGVIAGRLASQSVSVRGDGSIAGLGCGPMDLGDTRFQYEWSDFSIRLSGLDIPIAGGRFRGSGRWQFLNSKPATGPPGKSDSAVPPSSQFWLLGSFEDAELSELASVLPFEDVDIRGAASGELQLKIDVHSNDPLQSLRATGRIGSKRLLVEGMPIDASADFEYDGAKLTATSLSASMAAGKVTGTARLEITPHQRVLTADLQSANLNLSRFADSLSSRSLRSLAGTAAGQLSLNYDLASGDVVGQGAGRIQSLAVPDLPVIASVLARRFELRNGRILLPEFRADLWGGSATGSCQIDLHENAEKLVDFSAIRLDRVDLSQIASTWPDVARTASGKLSGTGKLAIVENGRWQTILGSGDYTVDSTAFAGLALGRTVGTIESFDGKTHEFTGGRVQAIRDIAVANAKGHDQRYVIKIRESHPARGKLQATVLVVDSGMLTYDAALRFSGVDLPTVVQSIFAGRYAVTGSLSGEMRLAGSERGQDDARGDMWFRVDNGNLWRLPVLAVFVRESSRVLNRLLNLNLGEQGAQTAVARRVTLENRTIHVHEFWISGDVGRLFGEGTIGLDGRIDLDFVGNFETGLTKNVPVLGQLNGALNFLQQRLVKVHLSGTLSDPVAIPVPLQDLTEPAEKFFRSVITGTLFDDSDRRSMPR